MTQDNIQTDTPQEVANEQQYNSLEEAVNYFAQMKQLPKKEFLKLFIVTEIK